MSTARTLQIDRKIFHILIRQMESEKWNHVPPHLEQLCRFLSQHDFFEEWQQGYETILELKTARETHLPPKTKGLIKRALPRWPLTLYYEAVSLGLFTTWRRNLLILIVLEAGKDHWVRRCLEDCHLAHGWRYSSIAAWVIWTHAVGITNREAYLLQLFQNLSRVAGSALRHQEISGHGLGIDRSGFGWGIFTSSSTWACKSSEQDILRLHDALPVLWRYDTGFTYLLITEQILLDNSNAGEDPCMLLSPVLLKVVEAQAWLAIYKKRQSHSFLRHDWWK